LKKRKLGGAVYVLPNLITTGNLFWGFFAVMKALQGEFAWAGSAILLAAVFDVLDGRVARLTKGTSEFGVQYDSLCDLISFGMAPAIIMYEYGLHAFGRIGWVICFLYMACGALRLARFNVQSSIGKAAGDFTGLPIPMAAAVIATFVLFMNDLAVNQDGGYWLTNVYRNVIAGTEIKADILMVVAPLLSLAMVSNIAYRSHKALKVRGIKPFKLLAVLVFVIALLAYQPEAVGFVLVALYALSGPFEWAIGWKKPIEEDDIFESNEDEFMDPHPSEAGEGRDQDADEDGVVQRSSHLQPFNRLGKSDQPS